MMKNILMDTSNFFSTGLEIIAGVALMGMMLLTGGDILGRAFGHPIPGTYEVVSFAGGLVIGLAVPVTSRERGHVMVDILITHLSKKMARIFHIVTRMMVIVLFLLMAYAAVKMGTRLYVSGEMTAVLSLPFYVVAYAMGGAFFIESLVLVTDMIKNGGDEHE